MMKQSSSLSSYKGEKQVPLILGQGQLTQYYLQDLADGSAWSPGQGHDEEEGESQGRNPVKVVYIGDPKKVQASAADFRALVQELTGWNASSMSVRLKPLDLPFAEESPKADVGGAESLPGLLPVDDRFASPPELPISDQASPDHHQSLTEYSDFSIESFNEWILQQMLDVSSGSFQSPSLLYGLSSETCAL